MKVKIHKRGIISYLIGLVLSIIFASYYGGPVSFAWLYGMLLIIPVSILYTILNYKFLNIFQEIEVYKVTKGEEHRYRVLFENAGIFPVHRMGMFTLDDRCSLYEIKNGQEISLDNHEKKELLSGITCKYAGAYNIGIDRISLTDPFYMYTVELDVQYNFRAIVRPQITDVAAKVLDIENLINNTGLKSNRLYEDTPGSDMRPYYKGDSLNAINWKVSAKQGELMVRTPDKMEKRTVTILMEASNPPESREDLEYLKKRDIFLEFVVSAAWHFGEQGVPVRLIYPSGDVKESTVDSRESFMDFYSIVADGIFYGSSKSFKEIQRLVEERRSKVNEGDTWIIIREDPDEGESSCIICG
ncbi:Protein of unknown function DUF58 [Pseudobutyrivibrio sp. 49]|uniref:DUF58 domain-containing protein n=1 Tax=unclassified Pseudobutyrivibrio TaxID=2638619 RepID=UPI00088D4B7D|nr:MULTISPECIES: DUF58 domain-containing protein [unclassified Pseudobutyrivibrio]SDH87256.1 Protein of unknown function DUF58 [Pseudobutyrivibrio sp. 49]SFO23820.1 Protein of unknown function DUF58 [Pseudobutyrivibrio sp. UC1225]